MKPEILVNEIFLFLIGTGFGIIANLHLKNKKEEFETLAARVDKEIRGVLKRMAEPTPIIAPMAKIRLYKGNTKFNAVIPFAPSARDIKKVSARI